MKRRNRTEIIQLILQIVSRGATRPEIMYKAYLSYSQLNEYLTLLIKNKLIKRYAEQELYKITESGQRLWAELDDSAKLSANETQKKLHGSKRHRRKPIHKMYRFHG